MKQISNQHNIEYLKRCAKGVKKERKITHHQALDLTAKNLGYNNWKHLISESSIKSTEIPLSKKSKILKKSLDNIQQDPYRNLLIAAINSLIKGKYISLNLDGIDERNEKGHIFISLFEYDSVVIWRNIGFGELHISVWWQYDHNNHPQANLKGNSKENFNLSSPLAKRNYYREFVGITASCWLERRKGQYIQGSKRESIFDIYTRKGEFDKLKELPIVKPLGYKESGAFRV